MIITGGEYKSRKIIAPDEKIARPTLSKVRQGVFNVLFSELGDFSNKSFLDLFGGSGIMGIEAISRGFQNVYVFEKNPKAAQVIKKNYSLLGLDLNLKIGDSLKLLSKFDLEADVVYVDPPYYSGIYEKVLSYLKKDGFKNSLIVLEHSVPINYEGYRILKEKSYGGKFVTFLKSE